MEKLFWANIKRILTVLAIAIHKLLHCIYVHVVNNYFITNGYQNVNTPTQLCQDDKHIAKIVASYFICDNTCISYDMSSQSDLAIDSEFP